MVKEVLFALPRIEKALLLAASRNPNHTTLRRGAISPGISRNEQTVPLKISQPPSPRADLQ